MCAKSGLQVNLSLLPVKVTYFLFFAAIAVLQPYLPVYMKALGLTPAESAIILSVTTACTGIVRAIAGVVADKLRSHRLIIFIFCIIGGVFNFAILFVPPVPADTSPQTVGRKICCRDSVFSYCDDVAVLDDGSVQSFSKSNKDNVSLNAMIQELLVQTKDLTRQCAFQCCGDPNPSSHSLEGNDTGTKSQNCRTILELDATFLGHCANKVANCSTEYSSLVPLAEDFCRSVGQGSCSIFCQNVSSSSVSPTHVAPKYQETFALVFILFFIGQSAFSPIFNLLDSLVYVYLGDKHGEFGKQRLWGTIAFGTFALKSGFIMDALEQNKAGNSYLYSFIAFLVLLFLTGLSVYFYKATPMPSMSGIRKNIRFLFSNFYLVVIYVVMLVAGILAGVLEAFFYWFLKMLGAGQLVIGVALLVACITETIVLFFSGKIISKFGFGVCLYIVFAAFSARMLANSFIENPWVAVVTEASQCICFGLLYPTVTSWGSTLTPPGMHGTVQGIMGAMYMSIGRAAGAAMGGACFEAYGPRMMFRIFSVVAFVFMIVLVILLEVAKRKLPVPAKVEVDAPDELSPEDDLQKDGRGRVVRDETKEELLEIPNGTEGQHQNENNQDASEREMATLVST